jgi:hypothetical protein
MGLRLRYFSTNRAFATAITIALVAGFVGQASAVSGVVEGR